MNGDVLIFGVFFYLTSFKIPILVFTSCINFPLGEREQLIYLFDVVSFVLKMACYHYAFCLFFIIKPNPLFFGSILILGLRSLLTYLGLLQLEHRPSTIPLQHTRFWTASHAPFQLSFGALSSASVSRLQLLQGRPLLRFPWGFQLRACRVMLAGGFLSVWPIQPHFRSRKPCTYFFILL